MTAQLPRLAVAYGERSVGLLELAAAAVGVCDLVWLIDGSKPGSPRLARIAAKVGEVVDLAELPTDEACALLHGMGVAGLVTFFDADMVRLAHIAAGLGLRFHPPEVAVALTDKARQRQILAAAGLPGPRAWLLPPEVDPREVADRFAYPSVLKPRIGDGSRETYRLDGPADLVRYLEDMRPREPMVVEEMLVAALDGPFAGYVSVESLLLDGASTHVAVTGRFPTARQFRETGFFVPAAVDEATVDRLTETTDQVLAALGVRDGATHTEFVLTADGPRLLEVNGRLGGGIPDMLRLAGGPDLLPVALRLALGEPPAVEPMAALSGIGYRFLVQPPAGVHRVREYRSLDALAALPGVASVSVHHAPGTVVDTRHGSRSFVFAATGRAANRAELLSVAAAIQAEDVVAYEVVH